MAALVRATPLAHARLILHSARWAERKREPGGSETPLTGAEIMPGRSADLGRHNALLTRYEAAFTALLPPLARIEAPAERVADAAHRWGLSPFHSAPEYYAEIWRQLDTLGVRPAVPA